MPNTLPVPSKAALRTLRNLALGTSCTVAFTTGLLTEDRRRRIHAAREVHANAQKLKSSRKYHSAGSPSAESFEEQVMRYRDDGFWQANDPPRTIEPAQAVLPLEPKNPELVNPRQEPPFSLRISRYEILNKSATRWKPIPAIPPSSGLRRASSNPPEIDKQSRHDRQHKLAFDVRRLLQDKKELSLEDEEGSSNVVAAAVRFFDAFEEGLPVDSSGLRKELLDAAVQLSIACQLEQRLEARHKILDIVLGHGPIDEDTFFSLGAERIVRKLIEAPRDEAIGHPAVEDSKLRKAVALYLTKFKEKPKIATDRWRCLGETLCATTCGQGLFDLTEALYWRVDQCRGNAPNRSINQLMIALYNQARHKEVVKIFRRLFGSTPLDKSNFYKTGDIVVESTLKVRRIDIAEETLVTLAKISEDSEVLCAATWFTKVLRSDWENYGDITKTQALFERLAPNFHCVTYPQAVYGAIIQFCIEAGDETAAQSYYDRHQKAHGSVDADGVRILGHFAYAKAIRNDWTGVKEDFRKMWQLDPGSHVYKNRFRQDYSASFVPIFTLFAKTHSVNETEGFLRTFIDHLNVTLTPYMSTTMVTKYAEAHEIDSISRWLEYMISVESPADPMFFNAIISNCRTKWKFSFDETYTLYQKLRKMEGRAAHFINSATFSILRVIAMAEAGRDAAGATRKLNRLKLDQPLKNPGDSRSVQMLMAIALARGNPQKALHIYERAQNTNIIPLDVACVTTAVKASLREFPNDIYAAASLLRRPQIDGLNVSAAVATIFVHQMSYQCSIAKQIRVQDIARNTIVMLEERGITVGGQMITHAMRTLVSQGQYYQAAEFWDSMSRRQNTPTSLDLPTLTVLLQAYVGVQDCIGVEWVIQMLLVNGLVPDKIFKRPLKNALRVTRALLNREYRPADLQFYKVVKNALQSIRAMRLETTKGKEDFKFKTINIMERAIEFQRTINLDAGGERSSKSPLDDDSEPIDGLSKACGWMEPKEEPDYHAYVPSFGRLVGVNAG
jgi:tetratricopeptide (TPR) repeat protein